MYWSYIISISTKHPQISLVIKTAILPRITGWVQSNTRFVIKLLPMMTIIQIDIESRVKLRKKPKTCFSLAF